MSLATLLFKNQPFLKSTVLTELICTNIFLWIWSYNKEELATNFCNNHAAQRYHNSDIFSPHVKIRSLAIFTEIPVGILKKKKKKKRICILSHQVLRQS